MITLLATVAALAATPASAPTEPELLGLARQQLERTVTEYPSDTRAHALLARTLDRSGRHEAAIAEFQIAAAQGDLEALMREAHDLLDRDEYAKGLEKAKESLALCRKTDDHDHEVDALLMVAYATLELGHYDEAMAEARHLLANPPRELTGTEKARAYSTIGGGQGLKAQREGIGALLTIGPRVKGTFEKAIAADPDHARAWYGLGRYYLDAPLFLNDKTQAEKDIHKAVTLDPHDLNVRAWYVYVLQQRGKSAKAKEQLAKFQRDFGDIPAAKDLASRLEAGQAPD